MHKPEVVDRPGWNWLDEKEFRIEFDPVLVEESVLRRMETRPSRQQALFRRERDLLYPLQDPEKREDRFRRLHGRWFQTLELGVAILQVVREFPTLPRTTSGCYVLATRLRKGEGADLRGHEGNSLGGAARRPAVVIHLRTETLLEGRASFPFLRHELCHVADMLDPMFGYSRNLPRRPLNPTFDTLLRARYHVLWDANIDGRLADSGRLSPEIETIRRREFEATFPMLGDGTAEAFRRFFSGGRMTHNELLAFASDPLQGG